MGYRFRKFGDYLSSLKAQRISIIIASVAAIAVVVERYLPNEPHFSNYKVLCVSIIFFGIVVQFFRSTWLCNGQLNDAQIAQNQVLMCKCHSSLVCEFFQRFWNENLKNLENESFHKKLFDEYYQLMRESLNSFAEKYCDKEEKLSKSCHSQKERFSFFIKLKEDGSGTPKYKCIARGSHNETLKRESLKTYEKGVQLITEHHEFILRPNKEMIKKYKLKKWDNFSCVERLNKLCEHSKINPQYEIDGKTPTNVFLENIGQGKDNILKHKKLGYYKYHFDIFEHSPKDVAKMNLRSTVYIGNRLKYSFGKTSWHGAIVYESTHTKSLDRLDQRELKPDMKNFSDIFAPFMALFRHYEDTFKPEDVIKTSKNSTPLNIEEKEKAKKIIGYRNYVHRSIAEILGLMEKY